MGAAPARRRRHGGRSATHLLTLGFAALVAVGTLLLRLPAASAGPHPLTWTEALFTSTSAVTVTGLTVINTALDLSLFGQVLVLLLLQVGGVGFIAFSVVIFRLIGRRVTFRERFVARDTLGVGDAGGVAGVARTVLAVTIGIELAGAALLWLRWRETLPAGRAAWLALFHATSAYCNAGFDLFSGTPDPFLFGYGADGWSLGVLGAVIVLGGLGVPVLYDLWDTRARGHGFLSLHTRLALVATGALTAVGFLLVGLDPAIRAAGAATPLTWLEARAVGLFTVVSARTAGVTVVDLAALSPSSHLVLLTWMFIGASPASMAGGVGTSTVMVILVAVVATVRGDAQPVAFGRSLPPETIAKAMAVMTVSTLLVTSITLLLVFHGTGDVMPVAFEVVSAFSNTGYSLDVTPGLDVVGRLAIAFAMFWGRLGPLTLVYALAQRQQPTLVRYPEEPVILG